MNDYVEFDDRGYVYAADRVGTGVTILKLTGDALKATQPLTSESGSIRTFSYSGVGRIRNIDEWRMQL